jgi:hypothetical protein
VIMRGVSATKKRPSRNAQEVTSITAPVGGLNARDPLSAMPPTDAYDLQNWIPQQFGAKMRRGSAQWATEVGSTPVKSVMNYFPNTASFGANTTIGTTPVGLPGKLFAATDAQIYDVTSAGPNAITAQALSGAVEAGRLSSVNFSNSAGTFLVFCSETDGYFTYDGTTFVQVAMGGGATQVSGGDPTDFCFVTHWKRRLWFVERNSSKVWYLAADALYGVAAELNLGPLLKRGGSIAWIASWTIDAGEGIDDFIVFCSDNGEVLIYKGSDPASADTFGLVGRWDVGQIPKGRRGFCQVGGDLLILSSLGIAPISFVTRGGSELLAASQKDYTSKISRQFNKDVSSSFNEYGWAMQLCAREGLLVMSTPPNVFVTTQYAMTLASGAWTRLYALDVVSMHEVGGWVFFGTSEGEVHLAFIGYTDDQPLVILDKNSGFDYDTIWTKNAAATIVNGYGVFDGVTVLAANTAMFSQSVVLQVGVTYRISYTIVTDTTNNINWRLNTSGAVGTTPQNNPGVYYEDVVCTNVNEVLQLITATGAGIRTGTVDDFTIREVDQDLTAEPISGVCQPAFNAFGEGGQLKHFLLCRLAFLAGRAPAVTVAMNVDFRSEYPISTPAISDQGSPSVWDTGMWDVARWSGDAPPYSVWLNAPGVGYYGSLTLMTASTEELILTQIGYVFEKGGIM